MEKGKIKSNIERREGGFSLIECVCALLITTVGLLAVAGLAITAVRTESFAYSSVENSTLAGNKMEEIKAGALVNGGSLTSNINGYSDAPNSSYFRRWEISDGPAGTKKVSLVVVPKVFNYQVRSTRIDTLIR